MILNIRGTSGSGKTTLVRHLMKKWGPGEPHFVEGRKRPLYYGFGNEKARVWLLGSYETTCGGCDTISGADFTFDLVRKLAATGHVVFEGLLLSGEVRRIAELSEDFPVAVIALSTTLEKCLEQVNARRYARNSALPPVKEANTASKYRTVARSMHRLAEEAPKVQCFTLAFPSALRKAKELIS